MISLLRASELEF